MAKLDLANAAVDMSFVKVSDYFSSNHQMQVIKHIPIIKHSTTDHDIHV
jgi:hypothetical protein